MIAGLMATPNKFSVSFLIVFFIITGQAVFTDYIYPGMENYKGGERFTRGNICTISYLQMIG